MSREPTSVRFNAILAVLLASVLLLIVLFPAMHVQNTQSGPRAHIGSRYDVYHNSTWTISTDTWINDTRVCLKADMVVDPGVKLTLVNSSIELDLDADGKYVIQLGTGSWLTLENSSVVNKTFRHFGFYGSGCTVKLYDSTLRGCGGEAGAKGTKGLELVNSDLYARNSNILMGDYGIYSINGALDLDGCNVSSHVNHGIYAERGSLVVKNTLVTSNLKTGIWSRFADEVLSGVSYKKGLMENNEMDLRLDRELTISIKDKEGAMLSEVDVSVINNRSVRTDLGSGPSAQPVTFQLTWYTLHGVVETLYYPYQIIAMKNGYARAEDTLVMDSNSDVSYILYPQGWFDSQLAAGLRAQGDVLLWNTTSWVEVNVSNTGYSAHNITVDLSQDGLPSDWGWLEQVDTDEWVLVNLSYVVKKGTQNLSVVVDLHANATESILGDNLAWVEVEGVERPVLVLEGPRKVYLNESAAYTASAADPDPRMEYRFNVSGAVGNWTAGAARNASFNSTAPGNISAQARLEGLTGPWSAEMIVQVFEGRDPAASFEANGSELATGGALFNFDASASYWNDFDVQSFQGLSYDWFIDGKRTNLTGVMPAKLFTDDGMYNVSLVVSDPRGRASERGWEMVEVKNQPPQIFMKYPEEPIEAKLPYSLHLSAANSTDPDDEPNELTYTWRVGDDIYTGQEVDIIFNKAGDHVINLTVEDDDGATDTMASPVTIMDKNAGGEKDSMWGVCCVLVVIVLIILIIVVVFFVRDPEKLYSLTGRGLKINERHLKLNKGKRQDFLIIKHPRRDLYRKYELYNVLDDDHHTALCVVWESAADDEWRIAGSLAGSKETVIEDINNYLDRDTGMKYGVDYWGNGKIVSKNIRDEEKEVPKEDVGKEEVGKKDIGKEGRPPAADEGGKAN